MSGKCNSNEFVGFTRLLPSGQVFAKKAGMTLFASILAFSTVKNFNAVDTTASLNITRIEHRVLERLFSLAEKHLLGGTWISVGYGYSRYKYRCISMVKSIFAPFLSPRLYSVTSKLNSVEISIKLRYTSERGHF